MGGSVRIEKRKKEKPALYETQNRGVVDSPPMLLAKLHLFMVPLTSDEIDLTGFYEILVYYYQITWHSLPNENRLHSHCHDNFKFDMKVSN